MHMGKMAYSIANSTSCKRTSRVWLSPKLEWCSSNRYWSKFTLQRLFRNWIKSFWFIMFNSDSFL